MKPSNPLYLYAVYPGDVSSRDGDIHYIGFAKLCSLYKVSPFVCVDMSRPEKYLGLDVSNLIALRPSTCGNYTLPTK